MTRKEIVVKIGDLLDICKGCTKTVKNTYRNHQKLCGGCETYNEIRKCGDMLNGEPFKLKGNSHCTNAI